MFSGGKLIYLEETFLFDTGWHINSCTDFQHLVYVSFIQIYRLALRYKSEVPSYNHLLERAYDLLELCTIL